MSNEFPLSEEFRIAGNDWAEKEYIASLLEDTKSNIMAQKIATLGDMPINRAEQTIKATQEWLDYIKKIVDARKAANLAKINMEFMKLKYHEAQSREATARAESRLG